MRALSIRQPWAWLIVNGFKDVENREWECLYRGPFLIHASQTMTKKFHRELSATLAQEFGVDVPAFDDLPRGGIVGVATLTGCVRHSTSPWFTGPFGFELKDARPLPFLPRKGQLNFFHVPEADVPGLLQPELPARAGTTA